MYLYTIKQRSNNAGVENEKRKAMNIIGNVPKSMVDDLMTYVNQELASGKTSFFLIFETVANGVCKESRLSRVEGWMKTSAYKGRIFKAETSDGKNLVISNYA